MMRVFVETAGHYLAVPGDDAGVPHFPAMVEQGVFDRVGAVGLLPVASVLGLLRNQIRTLLVIVDLCGFERDGI